MAKGKGKGRGRGRGKESAVFQQERPTEPGHIQRAPNLSENELCRPSSGRAQQFQNCVSDSQQLAGSSNLPNKFPHAQAEPGNVQRAPNVSGTELCWEAKRKTEQFLSNNSGSQQGMKSLKHPKGHYSTENTSPALTNKKECITNLSSGHRLLEENCSNGAAALQTQNSHHNQEKKPYTEHNVKDTMCSNSSNQMSANSSQVNIHNKSLVFSNISDPPRAAKTDIIGRPNFGTQGRPIEVIANYFLLKGSGNDIYHYDVEIVDKNRKKESARTIKDEKERGATQLEIQQRRSIGKQKCREIINQLINDKALREFHPFYDGHRNLYTFKPMFRTGKKSADITLFNGEKRRTYTVTVQPVNQNGAGNVIDLGSLNEVCKDGTKDIPQEAIMAFDMILCHRDPPFNEISVGRSVFSFSEMRKTPLDCQVEIWKGYNRSVHLTLNGPAVVVNVANKAFHSAGFVIEFACDVLGFDITKQRLRPDHIQTLSKSLSSVKVEVTHLSYPRKYTVNYVTKVSADRLPVSIEGKDMSVAQFFSQRYKPLKFPDLPCLAMKSTGRPTYTPMEFCVIPPGQPKLGKLNRKQTSDMMNETAIPPEKRFQDIMNYAKDMSETSGAYIGQSGYRMQLTPMGLMARIISAPALIYKNESSVQPDNRGVWRIDHKNFTKVVPHHIKWCLISFADPYRCPGEMLQRLSSALVTASRNVGLNLNPPSDIQLFNERTSTSEALIYAKELKVNFAFVVLSRNDRFHSYDELKFIADVKVGLVTQCMEDIVVSKSVGGPGSGQILNNIFSKLNIKLGGVNHTISRQPSVSMKGTIVMGADAAHSPRGSKCPSIAAVVGSIDHVPFQYAVSCRVQENPDKNKLSQEIILKMKEMTKHVLQSYVKNNQGEPPQKIIFFRDGVSEGQFDTVLQKELRLIKLACHEMFKKPLPVTFIIVQKRHQTRFIPRNSKEGVGRGGNVPPGTTVDTDVVHPVYFDFFICSHEGIKGTSKPAHYVVLHDDNKFLADDLQKFCYELCHVYARCNRSISIPAPAMNAHLAAARAKKYIDWHILNDTGSSSGFSNDESYQLPQDVTDYVNNISTIEAPMFFV